MEKLRYTIYDTAQQKWLSAYKVPVRECDAAVTRWTRRKEYAMRFPGTKSARKVARWLDANRHGGCVVLNAKGESV